MKRRISLGIIVALVLSMALWSVASAHAKLVSSDPAAGAKLDKAPAKVTLVFSEEISDKADESNVTVTDEQGNEVGKGGLDNNDLDHKTQTATLKAGLGDGIYTVKWNALTPDDKGHTEGTFTFGVNKDPGAQPTAAPEPTEEEAATPTAAAAGAAAQPTSAASASAPSKLPKTGESGPDLSGYFLIAVVILLAGGLALRRRRGRTQV
jgi:LPXTG-motif cell wall-anchored protein